MSTPVIDPKAAGAINQLLKDRDQMNDDRQQVIADMALLKEFLSSLDAIVKKDGPGVALMMLMSKGFSMIDEVKNDTFVMFSDKLNIATDYQTMGSLAEGYINKGGQYKKGVPGTGISLNDTFSLYLLLQQLKGAGTDPDLDGDTGKLVAGAATTITNILFDPNHSDTFKKMLEKAQSKINSAWSGPKGGINDDYTIDPIVKTIDHALDQISTATNSSSQMLQTEASTATNSYKSFLGVETKNFTNWSTLVGDINKKTSQAG